MTTTQSQIEGVDRVVRTFMTETSNGVLKSALREASKLVAATYRNVMLTHLAKPGNSGIHASDIAAITYRVGIFKDETGAWAVIGATTVGGQPLAPQLRFGATGTVQRQTKAGHNRGIMPRQSWLAQTIAQSLPLAQMVIRTRINHLVTRAGTD